MTTFMSNIQYQHCDSFHVWQSIFVLAYNEYGYMVQWIALRSVDVLIYVYLHCRVSRRKNWGLLYLLSTSVVRLSVLCFMLYLAPFCSMDLSFHIDIAAEHTLALATEADACILYIYIHSVCVCGLFHITVYYLV